LEITYLFFFLILGMFMGSFFTVVGLRLPNNEPIIFSRSICDKCKHKLTMLDMIPIFSYLFLNGKCRYCKKQISSLSSYMELYTGLLFATSYSIFGFSYKLLIALGIVSLLIIVSVSDINYLIIPDEIIIFFSIYFVIFTYLDLGLKLTIYHICSSIILFTLMYIIMLIGNKSFKKESLGGGDIKLMIIFGLILEPLTGIFSIFIASLFALPISLFLLHKNKEHVVPFGPFLLLALTFLYFLQVNDQIILKLLNFYN